MKIFIQEVDHQRNGVSGESFDVFKFYYREGDGDNQGPLIGVLFDAEKTCAVLNPLDLDSHFRGDHFEPLLREALKKVEAKRRKTGKNRIVFDSALYIEN